ncbi:DUF2252 domain-containing protein [Sphingomonas sp. QA11]|uniref:DUF2252 family protein n=1 Tax=Sphingomonas sp. QA11 TaxID=2950605 RepID=UPI00234982A1|nr:DUF2252 family protein [Sphingomonas sp. QA11]WCM27055.1 DUF2252 domain-containing protein [Sphingomonas sp. QA11]
MKQLSPSDRSAVLESARAMKMARSAHAFVRGNTAKFYDWLAASPSARRLPAGPAIWICGDCHLGNLGPLADGRGGIEIQIRDLDQTVIGNPAHDLIRLALSLATAARGSDLPGVVTARMIEQMVEGYSDALSDPDARGDGAGPGPEPDAVRVINHRALGRRWHHLARERIDDAEPQIPLGKKFWAVSPEERAALVELFEDAGTQRLILSLGREDKHREVRLVDAAWWVKGCSSLGLMRYAVVVAIHGAKGREEYGLIDVKEATIPAAPAARHPAMPKDQAERVVTGARALSPHLGERMIAATLLDRPVFLRELAPQDLKLEVAQFTRGEAARAARYLAYVVGKAHARQMETSTRAAWQKMLAARRDGALDAPSWLWESVVDLSGSHEAGYLEHCRQYALGKAA